MCSLTQGPRLDPAAKLFLQEAKADIRSVMKAVVKFKQLVARRRAERAAAAAAAGGTGADVAGSGAGRGNGQPSRGHSQKGGFANKSGAMPPSSVHIAPLSFSVKAEDMCVAVAAVAVALCSRHTVCSISGSLPRPSNPRAVRKSKSVSGACCRCECPASDTAPHTWCHDVQISPPSLCRAADA